MRLQLSPQPDNCILTCMPDRKDATSKVNKAFKEIISLRLSTEGPNFFCWLSARSCLETLEVAHKLWVCGFSPDKCSYH